MPIYSHLTFGVDLRGITGGVNMPPGWAQDAVDVLWRDDGAVFRIPGWPRVNFSAVSGRPIALWGFSYRGKNTPAADTARGGNFGLANSGANFTRRSDGFSAFVLLTTTTFYRWNPVTGLLTSVALPAGVTVSPVKPVAKVIKNNLYIVGWADFNLRYDPTDLRLYRWGWEAAPAVPTLALQAGGDLLAGAVYKYAISFVDNYTGEESAMGEIAEVTPSGANLTVRVTVPAYSGVRHFNDLATATDSDVGIVIWRTFGDREAFYFLAVLTPGTLFYDDGEALGVVPEKEPFRGTQTDEPRFTSLEEFRGRFYALSRFSDNHRMWFSDAGFFERFRVRSYKDLVVTGGDELTAIGRTDTTLLVHRGRGGIRVTAIEQGEVRPDLIPTDLPWKAGAVGPAARSSLDGYEYWLSELGPMRWREGLPGTEWIGKPLAPLFVDPTSGACRLNEEAKELSEVAFDWETATMRFLFASGPNTYPNHWWGYWVYAQNYNKDAESGWAAYSPRAQTMGRTLALAGLTNEGKPISPQERSERFVFADDLGYLYEYDIQSRRGGLPAGTLSKGFVVAGSTTSVVQVTSGLFTTGDGMKGMRFEIIYASGARETRKILSNTTSAITLETPLPSVPAAGDIFYVGGIPSFWRSWVDHMGSPHSTKRVLHLFAGLQRVSSEPDDDLLDWRVDIRVAAGKFPQTYRRERTATLNLWDRKIPISATGAFWTYEIANSRPDETFVVTNLEVESLEYPAKRKSP
jgi:hypothetical protein